MYYVFKVNLGAKVVESYQDEANLMKEDLLTSFRLAFDVTNSEKYYKIEFFRTSEKYNFEKDIELLSYETEKLYRMYKEIFNSYIKNGDVPYTNNFIKVNNKCSRMRRKLTMKYPFLNIAYNQTDDYIIEKYDIPTHYQVGKGINHIKKYYKLMNFLESANIKRLLEQKYNILYDRNEYLYIQAENDEEAKSIVDILLKIINDNEIFVGRMGRVNILPVTSRVNVKGKIKSITYTIVYPNGAKDRHELLVEHQLEQLRSVEGDESTTTINSHENLNGKFVDRILNFIGSKGYLKKVETHKKSDVEIRIKKVKIENE